MSPFLAFIAGAAIGALAMLLLVAIISTVPEPLP